MYLPILIGLKGIISPYGIQMTKIIKENIVSDSGVRAYEIDGMRVTMPEAWDDDKKQAWLEKARDDMHLRRNLKVIKKSGTATLLRAFRQHGELTSE